MMLMGNQEMIKKVDLEEDEEKEEKVHVKRNKSKVVRKEAVTSEKDIR